MEKLSKTVSRFIPEIPLYFFATAENVPIAWIKQRKHAYSQNTTKKTPVKQKRGRKASIKFIIWR